MTITELAREAKGDLLAYRYWYGIDRAVRRYRFTVMAPIREYSGRLRQRIEDALPGPAPNPWKLRWRKEFTKPLRDEWRQAMRGE